MRRKMWAGLGLSLAVGIIFFSFRGKKMELISPVVEIAPTPQPTVPATESAVMGFSTVASISATPTISPTRKITPTKTPTPTNTPTPTPVPVSSQEVNSFIDRFASQYGVDPNVLRHMALCESGFNSSATQGKYVGLFQFDSPTWKNIRKMMGEDINPDLRFSAEESVQTTAYALSIGKGSLWPNCMP